MKAGKASQKPWSALPPIAEARRRSGGFEWPIGIGQG
jgi:hypothetical protein